MTDKKIPEGWKEIILSSLCDSIDYGFTASAKQSLTQYKFLRITDIVSENLDWSTVPYCDISENITNKYKLNHGDIVIARTGASTGHSFYIKKPPYAIFASYLIRLKTKININSLFISYCLKTKNYNDYIKKVMIEKSAQPNANAKTLTSYTILLPPLPEQQAIAGVLSCLDDKIELLRNQNKTLENIAQALFKRWFVDFEFPNEEGNPYKSSGGKMIESELGLIPDGWRVGRLGEVLLRLESGRRPKGGVGFFKSGIPSIGAENIVKVGYYDYLKEKFISEEFFKSMNYGIIENRDVLLYKDGAEIGRKSLFGYGFPYPICAINEHVFKLRSNEEIITQEYLYLWLDRPNGTADIVNLNSNSAQPGINQEQVKSLIILLPNKEIIKTFSDIIIFQYEKLLKNCIQIQTLSKLRDALLPKLMKGEIRIKYKEEDYV